MEMDAIINDWKQNAERHDSRNFKFLRSLKMKTCPFLAADNRCTIYEVRPTSCAEYPHTDKPGFATRTHMHSGNALQCPAVFYIIEEMRARGVTVLLPFKDKIVYDGLWASYPLVLGGGIKRMLNDSYKRAKAEFGVITSLHFIGEQPEPEEGDEAIIVTYDRSGRAHETSVGGKKKTATCPLRLTQAQRRAVSRLFPHLAYRLLLDRTNPRTLQFTLDEIKKIAQAARAAVPKARTGMERNSLRHVGRPSYKPKVFYYSFRYQAKSWRQSR